MRFQIRTLQVPTKWGTGAFCPGFVPGGAPVTAGAVQQITGAPGTRRVPSPRPAALNDGQLGGPFNQPSSVAPDWFSPSIYVNPSQGVGLHFPGRIFGDSVMPTPSINLGRTALQWQHTFRIGGTTVTSSNRPFTSWPTYSGGKA
jgi:hypothetical protein